MFFNIVYRVGTKLARLYYKIFYRFSVEGAEKIPSEGGVLLAGSHKSNNDPVVIAAFVKRRLYFMAKQELFGSKLGNWFFSGIEVIPVARGTADVTAVKSLLRLLKQQKMTLLFPSGTRKPIPAEEYKDGAVLMASKSEIPVVPFGIQGSYRLFGKHKLVFGEPRIYDKSQIEDIHSETVALAKEIKRLAGEAE